MPTKTSQGKPHFATLDGLRGIAALSVVILHWFEGLGFTFFGSSWFAVDFFFMLSGFVVAYSYEERLKNGFSFIKFMLLRVIRLYPMIFLGAIIGFIRFEGKYFVDNQQLSLELIFKLITTLMMVPESLLFQNNQLELFSINIVFWSLFFEFIAYILFGALLFRLKNVALWFIAFFAFIGVCFWLSTSFGNGEKLERVIAIDGFYRVAFSFSIGVILFRIRGGIGEYGKKLPMHLLILLLAFFMLPRNILPWYVYAFLMLMILPMSIIVGINTKFEGKFKTITSFLGDISYPLYAIHTPLIWMLGFTVKRFSGHTEPNYVIWYGLIIIPFTIFLAHLALKLYDEPVRKWLKQKVLA